MASRGTPSQATRPSPSSASLISLDQTLVTMTVGRYKKTFSIHKHLLSSHSDYFRQSFENGQHQFDFPDVDSHIFTLFQWWLYAQASRSNESDAPSNGSLTYEQALGMMNGREPNSQNNTRAPAHEQRKAIAKLITGLSQLQGLEKLRQKTLPSWIYNKEFTPEEIGPKPFFSLFLQLYTFATEYYNQQLRDDILTVLIIWVNKFNLPMQHPADTEWIVKNIHPESNLLKYWTARIAMYKRNAHITVLFNALPKQILLDIIQNMSDFRDAPANHIALVSDCCMYHEHSDSEAINCHASYPHDGPFYAGFFRACLELCEMVWGKPHRDATDSGEPHGEGEQPVSEAGAGAEEQEPEQDLETALETEKAQEELPKKRRRVSR